MTNDDEAYEATVLRRMRSTRLAAVVLGLCAVAAVITVVYQNWLSWRENAAVVNEITGVSQALVSFARDHGGCLPSSLSELVEGDYIQRNGQGTWTVSLGPATQPCIIRDPAWFDVSWGICASEVDDKGMVVEESRMVVRPAKANPSPDFEAACKIISKSVGQHLAATP